MLGNILIIFIHALTPSPWTSSIEAGFEKELTKSGVSFTSRSYHVPEDNNTPAKILEKIKIYRPKVVVLTNDLKGDFKNLPNDIRKLGIPVFFAGKKVQVKDNKEFGFAGVYGRQNYKGSVKNVELIIGKKIKTVGIVSSPSPLIDLLVKNFREDLADLEIKEIKAATFEEWKSACFKLVNTEKVDVLLPYLPYGGTYKGVPAASVHWPVYAEALKKINLSTPSIGGGSLRNSNFPVLLAFAQTPDGLGNQVATKVYSYLKNYTKLKDIGFSAPEDFELQINVREVQRLGLKIPDDMYSYSTFLNNGKNRIEEYRDELDIIDAEIAKQLKRRQAISLQIGIFKKANNLPVITGKEEDVVINRTAKKIEAIGVDKSFSKETSRLLIKYSKITQYEDVFGISAGELRKKRIFKRKPSFFEKIKNFFWRSDNYVEEFPYTSKTLKKDLGN